MLSGESAMEAAIETRLDSPAALEAIGTQTKRLAYVVHVASLVLGAAAILWIDRHMWFLWDEWNFFNYIHPAFERRDWVTFFFQPYIGHWIAVPNLLWEIAYRIGGLHHYFVYLIPVLTAHVGVVALVRVALRRADVGPWLATALVLLVLLTGPGAANLAFGWQIEFVGALFFGLAQLLISDHDGPVDWRDAAGLLLGLLGLMCSEVFLAMIVMIGVNLVLRGRWQAAAVGVLPLVAAFAIWYVAIGHVVPTTVGLQPNFPIPAPTAARMAQLPSFAWRGISSTLDGLTGLAGFAGALMVLTLGLAARFGFVPPQKGTGLAYSMALAAVAFFFITAYGRIQNGVGYASEGRYLYIGAALFLPLIGAVVARVVADRRYMPAIAALFCWAALTNVTGLYLELHQEVTKGQNLRNTVEQLATNANLDAMPASQPVQAEGALFLDVGLVRELRDQRQLP
jgi:hypothetical protein